MILCPFCDKEAPFKLLFNLDVICIYCGVTIGKAEHVEGRTFTLKLPSKIKQIDIKLDFTFTEAEG